jgi:hypothetical protein
MKKYLIFISLLLLFSFQGIGAIIKVQSKHQYTAVNGTGYAFTSNNTAGNFIAVFVSGNRTGTSGTPSLTVTDTKGNTYTPLTLMWVEGKYTMSQIFYAFNIVAGANSVKVNYSDPRWNDVAFTAVEYSGIATISPLDVEATPKQAYSATTTVTSNSFNPQAGSLIFTGYANENVNPGVTTGTDMTVFQSDNTHIDIEGNNLSASSGSQTVSFNLTNSTGSIYDYNIHVACFKKAAAPALTVIISSQTNVNCNGNSTGAMTASASAGTSPYTYLWTGGTTVNSITGIGAGTYTVTVTDNAAGTAIASAAITQPASALSASISAQTNVSCYQPRLGAVTVSASGGTTAYTYSWTTGGATTIISAQLAGTYTVTVTDAHSCTTTTSANITQPSCAGMIKPYPQMAGY